MRVRARDQDILLQLTSATLPQVAQSSLRSVKRTRDKSYRKLAAGLELRLAASGQVSICHFFTGRLNNLRPRLTKIKLSRTQS